MILSPKEKFQQSQIRTGQWAQVVGNPIFDEAIDSSLLQLLGTMPDDAASHYQMMGAQKFVRILKTIHEKPARNHSTKNRPPQLPSRCLNQRITTMPAAPSAPPPRQAHQHFTPDKHASPAPVLERSILLAPSDLPHSDDGGAFGDEFAQLDAIDQGMKPSEAVKKTSARQSPPTPPEPAPDAKKEATDTSTESPKDAGSATPAGEASSKPVKAADLRAAYDGAKQKIKEYETKLAEREAKLKEYETKPPQDNKPLLEKLASLEKENNDFKEELKFTNYVKHPEFTEKYQKPYNEAWSKAVREIEQLASHAGRWMQLAKQLLKTYSLLQTLRSLLLTKELKQCLDEVLHELFDTSNEYEILAEAQEKAIADAKTTGSEREKQMKLQSEQRNAKVSQILQADQ